MSGAIKINGTSSGSTTITAPASGGDESIELSTALAAKADLAGATFTGDVVVSKSSPALSLRTASSGQPAQIEWRTGSSMRWYLRKNSLAESGANAGSNFEIARYDDSGTLIDAPLLIIRSSAETRMTGVYANTSASAANVFVDASGRMLRSTSSLKYKTDVQDATVAEQDAVLALRPVTYKSLSDTDDATARFWGFIAEEVEEIDPRLVTHNDDGEPEGVQYDRIIPALVGIVRRQQQQIDALTARLDAAGL